MWCFHDRLKQYTFSNGVTIKCCVDCTYFDNRRAEVLRVSNIEMPPAKQQTHWKFLLEEAGLSDQLQGEHLTDNGGSLQDLAKIPTAKIGMFIPNYWDDKDRFTSALPTLKKLYDQRRIDAAKHYTPVDDHDWVARQRPFYHSEEMPRRFTSYCVHCIEVVLSVKRPWVVRITKGVYLPVDHECNSVRVYNLQGNLIEVKAQ